jgi:hypothetical protein
MQMQSPAAFSRLGECGNYVHVLAQPELAPTESERWAWVAGLFEGEGCVTLSATGTTYQRRLDITNTERDVLDQTVEFAGLGRIAADSHKRPGHHKQRLYWYVSAWREIEEVANRIYPFLGRRRRSRLGGSSTTHRRLRSIWTLTDDGDARRSRHCPIPGPALTNLPMPSGGHGRLVYSKVKALRSAAR